LDQLTELRYNALAGYARSPWTWITSNELEWYSEAHEKVLGVLIQDTTDLDFACVVMGRDRIGRYRAVHLSPFVATVGKARTAMSELLPQYALLDPVEFEQGDEPKTRLNFFNPVHDALRLDGSFHTIATRLEFSPAKGIMEAMMYYFQDPDGNFVEQFQSTAFGPRLWELYLFAVLGERRFYIDRDHPAPDYSCRGLGGEFFIEAVTANASMKDGINVENGRPMTSPEFEQYMEQYLPLKFSGPLTQKLKRRYWEEPHIGDRPIILAIADFHFPDSQKWSQSALARYLYGLAHQLERDADGHLLITWIPIREHVLGTKRVQSGFFQLPDAEHISAVMSTREADIWKFNRLGLKAGFGATGIQMVRRGTRSVPNPDVSQPERFAVEVHTADYEEEWIDGLEVYHNPNTLHPLDPSAFPGAVHHFLEEGRIVTYANGIGMFGTETFFPNLSGNS
jgi:hypothetical protein